MPSELLALQAELAALWAEVHAMRDVPAAQARCKVQAEAWIADLAWRDWGLGTGGWAKSVAAFLQSLRSC